MSRREDTLEKPHVFHSMLRQAQIRVGWELLACIGMALCVVGCEPGGENSRLSLPSTPSPQLEEQAIAQVLDLYRTAVIQEDVDRLETLFQTAAAPIQAVAPAPRQHLSSSWLLRDCQALVPLQ